MSTYKIPEGREQLIVTAKLAEQCERFDEMLVAMKRVVKSNADLSNEERNLLSVAYKNVIGSRRACWRAVAALEQKDDVKRASGPHAHLIRGYKVQIEGELAEICVDILELLDKFLIPAAPTDEAKVFYLKMKGDYHRYFAETHSGDEQRELALDAYTKATEFSASLKPTNPIRLGLALNFSVFYYEILKQPDKGCSIARSAFEEALADPNISDEDQHKEAALIMQLLRENLSLWTEDTENGADGGGDGTQVQDL